MNYMTCKIVRDLSPQMFDTLVKQNNAFCVCCILSFCEIKWYITFSDNNIPHFLIEKSPADGIQIFGS